jgi:hypothetical protein
MLPVLQVDYAYDATTAHQRHRQKGFIAVFGKFVEELESRIQGCLLRDGYRLAVFRDPSGDALS